MAAKRDRQCALALAESRLAKIAAGYPGNRAYQAFAMQDAVGLKALLEQEGYRPVRAVNGATDLEGIPDSPRDGIEVRPALPEHYRATWDAGNKAFRDHWGYSPPTEEDYQAWLGNKAHLHLWQIAWDVATDQVAGQVGTCIDYAEERGVPPADAGGKISVHQRWHRRGLKRSSSAA